MRHARGRARGAGRWRPGREGRRRAPEAADAPGPPPRRHRGAGDPGQCVADGLPL